MQHEALVSVIVVNWNGLHFLKACLDSLLTQTYARREVIVVDNGSTDGSFEFLRSEYAGQIALIKNDRNDGYGRGANLGIDAAHGEFIALLNNDAVASPHWLAELIKGMSSEETIGMCACKVLFLQDQQRINSAGNLLYPDGISARRGFGELDTGQYDRLEDTLFPDGSAAFYRKVMLDEIGWFDEDFFIYSEDADLGLRGWFFGWRCVYVPTAVVYHVHSGTMSYFLPRKAMLVERNRLWLAIKLFPLPLLLVSPWFTLTRFFWNAYSVLVSRGSAGHFSANYSKTKLLLILLRAYGSGIRGLPSIIRKRRAIRRRKRMSDGNFIQLIRRFSVSAREIALRDR